MIYYHFCKNKEKRGVWVCMCLNIYVLICVSTKYLINKKFERRDAAKRQGGRFFTQ